MGSHASYHPKDGKHYVVIRTVGVGDKSVQYRTAEHAYFAIEKINKAATPTRRA